MRHADLKIPVDPDRDFVLFLKDRFPEIPDTNVFDSGAFALLSCSLGPSNLSGCLTVRSGSLRKIMWLFYIAFTLCFLGTNVSGQTGLQCINALRISTVSFESCLTETNTYRQSDQYRFEHLVCQL